MYLIVEGHIACGDNIRECHSEGLITKTWASVSNEHEAVQATQATVAARNGVKVLEKTILPYNLNYNTRQPSKRTQLPYLVCNGENASYAMGDPCPYGYSFCLSNSCMVRSSIRQQLCAINWVYKISVAQVSYSANSFQNIKFT